MEGLPNSISKLLPPREAVDLHGLKPDIIGDPLRDQLQKMLDKFYSGEIEVCGATCQLLLDVIWEHLNTGHWKDVDITWRFAYSYVSLYKAACEIASMNRGALHYEEAIKTCDMGLLMGAPVWGNILNMLVTELQRLQGSNKESRGVPHPPTNPSTCTKRQKVGPIPSIPQEREVRRISCPSLEQFRKQHMDTQIPVIVTDSIDFWPALSTRPWNLEYIKEKAGYRTVPIELGSKYTEESWSQTLMTVREFIETYIENPCCEEGGSVGYLAQHQLFDQIPELMKDMSVPTYCCLGDHEDVDVNAWFGPMGTVSPLHHDPKHNLLAQVVGQKYIKLYSYDQTDNLYPHEGYLLNNTSQVDVETPDLEKFPLFGRTSALECVLKPGEMLYMPPKYWHYVRSLSISFSASFWWD